MKTRKLLTIFVAISLLLNLVIPYTFADELDDTVKEKEAKEMYKDSAELYGLFWALNVESKGKIKINEDSKETKGIFASIKKLLECCIE